MGSTVFYAHGKSATLHGAKLQEETEIEYRCCNVIVLLNTHSTETEYMSIAHIFSSRYSR